MPPRCAKCATPSRVDDSPNSSAITPNTIASVRAFIGIGGISSIISRCGNIIANAISSPYTPPDAPSVGPPPCPDSPLEASASCTTAAPITHRNQNVRNRLRPQYSSSDAPNVQTPSALNSRCPRSACRNEYVTSCHGMKPALITPPSAARKLNSPNGHSISIRIASRPATCCRKKPTARAISRPRVVGEVRMAKSAENQRPS